MSRRTSRAHTDVAHIGVRSAEVTSAGAVPSRQPLALGGARSFDDDVSLVFSVPDSPPPLVNKVGVGEDLQRGPSGTEDSEASYRKLHVAKYP